MDEKESDSKLENEIAWCIDQLLQSINSGKLSDRKGIFLLIHLKLRIIFPY